MELDTELQNKIKSIIYNMIYCKEDKQAQLESFDFPETITPG